MAIIEDVERRLLNWARWKIGGCAGGMGYASVNFSGLPSGGSKGAIVQSGEPEETERAVSSLDLELQVCVRLWYLEGRMTAVAKAARLGCCVPVMYRRREQAHRKIQVWLSDRAQERRSARDRGMLV